MSLSNLIDIATDERQTEDNWAKIIDVCEKGSSNSKECLKLILRRLFNKNPHIVLRSIILLDACVQNIGESFTKELSSRYFVNEIKSKSKNLHQKALERLCFMMKKWSRELTGSEYDCINELNKWLQDTYPILYAAGDDELNSKNSNKTIRKNVGAQEDDDLAKAIALSLKESEQKRQNLYPVNVTNSLTNPVKLPIDNITVTKKQLPKVRALYDFEAAEDNELTFKAGEIIIDVDTSNEHWWYGSNHRGQGMFPAQFVSIDLENEKSVDQVNSTTEKNIFPSNQQLDSYTARPPTPVIDEAKVDECLLLIEDADPTGEMRPDPPELSKLEAQCRVMGPLIDQELEKVDRHYNMLVELNRKTIESFQLYNELMTQGGMSRQPNNYMWPTNMPNQGMQSTPYMSMPMQQQDLSQAMARSIDNMNPGQPITMQDQMMFQPMNVYGHMSGAGGVGGIQTIQGGPEMNTTMYGPPQHFINNGPPMIPSNHNFPVPQSLSYIINQKQQENFPNNANNSALSFTDNNFRSLPPVHNNYPENSFPSNNMNPQNFSYVQKEQTFPVTEGFH